MQRAPDPRKSTGATLAPHCVRCSAGVVVGALRARFQTVCVAWRGFRQNRVDSSYPPAGNASRWAADPGSLVMLLGYEADG